MFAVLTGRAPDTRLDPRAVIRSAREMSRTDPYELVRRADDLVRRADVPQRVESGLDAVSTAASGAARDLLDHVPGRRRRRHRPAVPAFLVLTGALAAIGLAAAWWTIRGSAAAARAIQREDDASDAGADVHAIERAEGEGMGMASTASDIPWPTGNTSPTGGGIASINGLGD